MPVLLFAMVFAYLAKPRRETSSDEFLKRHLLDLGGPALLQPATELANTGLNLVRRPFQNGIVLLGQTLKEDGTELGPPIHSSEQLLSHPQINKDG